MIQQKRIEVVFIKKQQQLRCLQTVVVVVVLMLTVVDEGSRSEPQLCAAFPGGVHNAEVVDAGPQHGAVGWTQLGDAAQQNLNPLTHEPAGQ